MIDAGVNVRLDHGLRGNGCHRAVPGTSFYFFSNRLNQVLLGRPPTDAAGTGEQDPEPEEQSRALLTWVFAACFPQAALAPAPLSALFAPYHLA